MEKIITPQIAVGFILGCLIALKFGSLLALLLSAILVYLLYRQRQQQRQQRALAE
jgi:hypothetical protein